MLGQRSARRAKRALERQLGYQKRKSEHLPEDPRIVERDLIEHASSVRRKIESVHPIHEGARVLEVGSGAHGVVFFLGIPDAIGVDPLAHEYARLFPKWQSQARTVAAAGEALPFADASFDVVVSDNVVDHAADPVRIVAEIARVLAPGGILYFTVNVHHPVYGIASRVHALWQWLGPRYEIAAFADHTVHLTLRRARRLFDSNQWFVLHEESDIDEARERARHDVPRHVGDRMKRVFFKNARLEILAKRR